MELWIARDKNKSLNLYFSKPIKLEERGFFYGLEGRDDTKSSIGMNKKEFPE